MSYDGFNSTITLDTSLDPLIADCVIVILNAICGELIGLVGIVANVISILIFCKIGFHDSVDVTLTALAISDIGALVSLQFYNIMINPWISSLQLPFEVSDVVVLISLYPHIYFIRVSGLITAFAALERCVCVALPLKVKEILSCKRSILILVIIFIVSISNVIVPFYYFYLDWIFSPERNATMLRVIPRENWYSAIGLSYMINDIFIQYATFVGLVACTVITGITLHRNAIWRRSLTNDQRRKVENTISPKEIKVVRMLSLVSVSFIVCLLPLSATLTAVGIVKDLSLNGVFYQIARLCYSVSFLLETISSSMNAFIYYNMSSKFRKKYHMLFAKE